LSREGCAAAELLPDIERQRMQVPLRGTWACLLCRLRRACGLCLGVLLGLKAKPLLPARVYALHLVAARFERRNGR